MEAQVQLTGNVGGGVDFYNNTVPMANFRLAHTPRVLRNGVWTDAPTTWITVNCYRALAENVAVSLGRGQPVLVVGRLRTKVWEKDGVTYERLALEATSVGHDLSRGTASFVRRRVASAAIGDRDGAFAEMPDEPTPEDQMPDEEQVPGDQLHNDPAVRLAERDRSEGELVDAWSHG